MQLVNSFDKEIICYTVTGILTYRLVQAIYQIGKVLCLKYQQEINEYFGKFNDIPEKIIWQYIQGNIDTNLPRVKKFVEDNIQQQVASLEKMDLSNIEVVISEFQKLFEVNIQSAAKQINLKQKKAKLTNYYYKDVEKSFQYGIEGKKSNKRSKLQSLLMYLNPFSSDPSQNDVRCTQKTSFSIIELLFNSVEESTLDMNIISLINQVVKENSKRNNRYSTSRLCDIYNNKSTFKLNLEPQIENLIKQNQKKEINLGYQSSSEDEVSKSLKKGKIFMALVIKELKEIVLSINIAQYFFYGVHFDIQKVQNKLLLYYQKIFSSGQNTNNQSSKESQNKVTLLKLCSILYKIMNEEFLNENSDLLSQKYYEQIIKQSLQISKVTKILQNNNSSNNKNKKKKKKKKEKNKKEETSKLKQVQEGKLSNKEKLQASEDLNENSDENEEEEEEEEDEEEEAESEEQQQAENKEQQQKQTQSDEKENDKDQQEVMKVDNNQLISITVGLNEAQKERILNQSLNEILNIIFHERDKQLVAREIDLSEVSDKQSSSLNENFLNSLNMLM